MPCLPYKPRKPSISTQVSQKAMVVLSDLHKKILDSKDESKYNKDDILSISNVVAVPPIPQATQAPPNGFNSNHTAFYGFISQIYEMKNENGITTDLKESTVSTLMKSWHNQNINGVQEHISNLVSFIGSQSGLSNAGKLRIIRLDLNEFLKNKK